MSRGKKAQIRSRKVASRGVWIAPDLERKIKGERGRRGLSEPPYGYYLQLADLVLKTSGSGSAQPESPIDSIPDPEFPATVPPKRPKLTLPKPPKSPKPPQPAKRKTVSPPPKISPNKLAFPKPPKRPG